MNVPPARNLRKGNIPPESVLEADNELKSFDLNDTYDTLREDIRGIQQNGKSKKEWPESK